MPRVRPTIVGTSCHVRAVVVTVACLCATTVLHTAAGGGLPVGGLALAAVLAFALGTTVARRRRTLPVVAAAMLGCQALMHLVLSIGGSHAGHQESLVPSPPMLAAHVAAAVATAAILCRADDVAHRWIDFWRTLKSPTPVLPVLVVGRPTHPLPSIATTFPSNHVDTICRRGPPSR